MGLKRFYQITCDQCGEVHVSYLSDTPRRARAAAKRDGWARRKVVVGRELIVNWNQVLLAQNIYQSDGTSEWGDDILRGRDFCPKCVEAMDGGEP